MGNAFNGIFQGVSEIIHWIDAPLIASAVMGHMVDAVDDRIAHIRKFGEARSILARSVIAPLSNSPARILANRSRFSSIGLSR